MKPCLNRVSVGCLVAMLAATAAASAQSPAAGDPPADQTPEAAVPLPRVFRPVFGGAPADESARQALDLSASVAEAYDDNVLADGEGGTAPGALQQSGSYTALSAEAAFRHTGRSVDFLAVGATNFRYYPNPGELFGTNHAAEVGLMARFGPRGRLAVNQSLTTASSYLHELFGAVNSASGRVATAVDDYALNTLAAHAYSTTATLTEGVGRRGSLTVSSNVRRTDFVDNTSGLRDLTAYELGAQFGRRWTREATLRVGYTFRGGQYGGAQRQTEHGIEVGIDYVKALSATRRTTFAVTTGSTVVNSPRAGGAVNPATPQQYRIVGDVAMSYQMSRTWTTGANYHRGLELIGGLSGPVYTDALNVTTDGFIGRRLNVTGTGAYSFGSGAVPGQPTQFSTYTGQVRLRYGLSRHWAAYTEYLHYVYQFDPALEIPAGLPPRLARNGARAGLMLNVPVRHR